MDVEMQAAARQAPGAAAKNFDPKKGWVCLQNGPQGELVLLAGYMFLRLGLHPCCTAFMWGYRLTCEACTSSHCRRMALYAREACSCEGGLALPCGGQLHSDTSTTWRCVSPSTCPAASP